MTFTAAVGGDDNEVLAFREECERCRPLLLRLTPSGREQEHRRQHPAAEQPAGAAIQSHMALGHESFDLFLQSVHVNSSM